MPGWELFYYHLNCISYLVITQFHGWEFFQCLMWGFSKTEWPASHGVSEWWGGQGAAVQQKDMIAKYTLRLHDVGKVCDLTLSRKYRSQKCKLNFVKNKRKTFKYTLRASRLSLPWHCWHFTVAGAVLCLVGVSAASLASTHWMPVAPLPASCDKQKGVQTLSHVPGGRACPIAPFLEGH